MPSDRRFHPLTTRLFPKGPDLEAKRFTGVAAKCDWVVLSGGRIEGRSSIGLFKRTTHAHPRTIFISMRHPDALLHWGCEILPKLQRRIVLITGSEDLTIPNQIDRRWPPFGPEIRRVIETTLASPMVSAWFCENLDAVTSRKFRPMPLGLVFPDGEAPHGVRIPDCPGLDQRRFRVLCAHRVRSGEQWEPRRRVSDLAAHAWSDFADARTEEIAPAAFEDLLQSYAFALCVEGGGLDPSPKAWQAMLCGCIPIIRRSALAPAYEEMPVLFVDDWREDALNSDMLEQGREMWTRWHGDRREEVIRRLSIDYWWAKIEAEIDRLD